MDNHAALLRYRQFNSLKYLTEFAGQNWLITPAALAVGESPPASIQRSVAKRQAEFLAGRICARAALQQLEGLSFIPAIGEDRAPVWPAPSRTPRR